MKFMSKNPDYELNMRPRFDRKDALNNPDLKDLDPRGWQIRFSDYDPLTKMWTYDTDSDPRLQGEENAEFKSQIEKELLDHETRDPQFRHYAPPATVEVPYDEIQSLRERLAKYESGDSEGDENSEEQSEDDPMPVDTDDDTEPTETPVKGKGGKKK